MIPCMRPHRVCRLLMLLAFMTSMPRTSRAQSSSSTSSAAAAVADSFFSAWGHARWRDAARLMDLDTFGKLRDDEVRSMRQTRTRHMTADEYMKIEPKMPRAVAEYQAAQFNERAGRDEWLAHDYANVSTVDSLAAISVDDAAARWLEARDRRYLMRRALEEQRARCNIPDSIFAQIFPFPVTSYKVLGTVVSDSLAYSLFEEETLDAPKSDSILAAREMRGRRAAASWAIPPSVLIMRRIGDAWRVAPSIALANQSSFMVMDCTQTKPAASRRSP